MKEIMNGFTSRGGDVPHFLTEMKRWENAFFRKGITRNGTNS